MSINVPPTVSDASGAERRPIADAGFAASKQPSVGYTPKLPDFCNLGVMVRLLVIVNLMVLGVAAARADVGVSGVDAIGFIRQFLLLSVVAQPALIFSLLLSCALKSQFAKLRYWSGVGVIAVTQLFVGGLFWWIYRELAPALGTSGNVALWQFAAFFITATAVVLFYFDLRARSLSPALTEARLQALQARIRPHFLFNSINAVLSLIREEPRRAERMLEDMAELFRVLMADNRQLRPLRDEVALCERYLEIEQIRLGTRLEVVWQTAEAPLDALVPPLILQPLIENAVYHGIEPLNTQGSLLITISAVGKQLQIRITNPYQSGSTHITGNRMAIANIRERLQLHFDAEAGLRATVENHTYIVNINMPIVTQAPHSPTQTAA
jgi:two-component system sensor histidine kinase AlgZ